MEAAAPDLTVGELEVTCSEQSAAVFSARVCNRGTEPVGPGVSVGFYAGAGEPACVAATTAALAPGACADVTCEAAITAAETASAVVDAEGAVRECHEGNNGSAALGVSCAPD